jgi:predicted transcriptional regulator
MAFWNPTRRRIIKRLSQEPSYPSQLSRELGIGQALVAKHLEALEEVGVVRSSMAESPYGPKRREYLLSRSVSVTVDFAPHFFNAQVLSFSAVPESRGMSSEVTSLMNRMNDMLEDAGRNGKFGLYSSLLADIDSKLKELQDERSILLYIRNYAMREVAKLIRRTDRTSDEKKVLYHVLDQHNKNVQRISECLNLRESIVRKILAEMRSDL